MEILLRINWWLLLAFWVFDIAVFGPSVFRVIMAILCSLLVIAYTFPKYAEYCWYIVREVARDLWRRHWHRAGRAIKTWWRETREWYPQWRHYKRQQQSCWDCCGHLYVSGWIIHRRGCPSARVLLPSVRRKRRELCGQGFQDGRYGAAAKSSDRTYLFAYEHGERCALADEERAKYWDIDPV